MSNRLLSLSISDDEMLEDLSEFSSLPDQQQSMSFGQRHSSNSHLSHDAYPRNAGDDDNDFRPANHGAPANVFNTVVNATKSFLFDDSTAEDDDDLKSHNSDDSMDRQSTAQHDADARDKDRTVTTFVRLTNPRRRQVHTSAESAPRGLGNNSRAQDREVEFVHGVPAPARHLRDEQSSLQFDDMELTEGGGLHVLSPFASTLERVVDDEHATTTISRYVASPVGEHSFSQSKRQQHSSRPPLNDFSQSSASDSENEHQHPQARSVAQPLSPLATARRPPVTPQRKAEQNELRAQPVVASSSSTTTFHPLESLSHRSVEDVNDDGPTVSSPNTDQPLPSFASTNSRAQPFSPTAIRQSSTRLTSTFSTSQKQPYTIKPSSDSSRQNHERDLLTASQRHQAVTKLSYDGDAATLHQLRVNTDALRASRQARHAEWLRRLDKIEESLRRIKYPTTTNARSEAKKSSFPATDYDSRLPSSARFKYTSHLQSSVPVADYPRSTDSTTPSILPPQPPNSLARSQAFATTHIKRSPIRSPINVSPMQSRNQELDQLRLRHSQISQQLQSHSHRMSSTIGTTPSSYLRGHDSQMTYEDLL